MRRRSAFTLVELLVVIGIIAVLVAILLPVLARARKSALTLQCGSNLRQIGAAWQMYANDNKGWLPIGLSWSPTPAGIPAYTRWFMWDQGVTQYLGKSVLDDPTAPTAFVPVNHASYLSVYYCPTTAQKMIDLNDPATRYVGYQFNGELGSPGASDGLYAHKLTQIRDSAEVPLLFDFFDPTQYATAEGPMDWYFNSPAGANNGFMLGLNTPHDNKGANFLFVDGHVSFMPARQTMNAYLTDSMHWTIP